MLLPEKYESIFDVSSKGPSSGSKDIYEVSTYTGSCCSFMIPHVLFGSPTHSSKAFL